MVGTLEVGEGSGGGGPASGVDYTEYRVNTDGATGEWAQSPNTNDDDPFETGVPVADDGQHVVEYRSVDNAGNEEDVKSVAFGIDSSDQGGTARLRVQGKPKVRKVGARKKQTKFRFRATNVGDADTGPVRLCAKGPKKRVRIKGPRCMTRANIPAGQTRKRPVQVRIKPKARGKVTRIKLIARGPNVANQRTTVRLRVRG